MGMEDSEAAKFLERDFNQCFAQLRHYDSQIWNVCRFAFTAYIAILGAATGMYQYSSRANFDLLPVVMVVLCTGFVFGLLLYCLIICNRAYYVLVCRYINEHRKLFLEVKPLGFENISGMYADPAMPAYFNWRSWQSWLSYIIALLNAVLAAPLVFYALDGCSCRWELTVTFGIIITMIQIGSSIAYLKSREGKGGFKKE